MMQFGLAMDLGNQRAGGVDREDFARFGIVQNRLWHAMRGKDHWLFRIWHLVELLDENRALGLQPFDDIFVMHDLVTDIDRRAMDPERFLHGIDGAHDSRAETARRAEKDM
jgi:hypothetical protein